MSRLEASGLIAPGAIKPAKGNTAKILKIFDPITFPIAISAFPLQIAKRDVANSGKLVPIATTVKPITRSEIL